MLIQLYEIRQPEEAVQLIDMGVDVIGSVLTEESRRRDPLIRETLGRVRAAGARSSLIPLFTAEAAVLETIEYHQPDMIHFCNRITRDDGSPCDCGQSIDLQETIRKQFPEMKITRTLPIAPPGEGGRVPTLDLARMFESVSDYFLTDTLLLSGAEGGRSDPQPVEGFIGITGKICDWTIARSLVRTSRIPVILAGGLGPGNVAEAIRAVGPAGVDSCTGTNARDPSGRPIRFRKDLERVRRFVAAVRSVPPATRS